MMNAEEDLDIDINLDEDDVQDGGILPELDPSMEQQEPTPAVSTTQVSTRPVPVIPKSMLIPTETNNLLNSPVIDKLDVKISEAGCLSSGIYSRFIIYFLIYQYIKLIAMIPIKI